MGGNVVGRVAFLPKTAYPDRADMIPEQQSTGRNASNRLTTRPFFSTSNRLTTRPFFSSSLLFLVPSFPGVGVPPWSPLFVWGQLQGGVPVALCHGSQKCSVPATQGGRAPSITDTLRLLVTACEAAGDHCIVNDIFERMGVKSWAGHWWYWRRESGVDMVG